MDRHYPQYEDEQQHQQGYPDYQYSYPPATMQQQDARYLGTMDNSNSRPYDDNSSRSSLGYDEKQLHMQRQTSYADSDAETRVASLYDEKNMGAQSSDAAINSSNNGMNPAGAVGMEEYIPPAVPRPRNTNKNFAPGHISRGSVAIQAAAAGEIPKKEALKMWRSDEHHGTFTAGGKGRAAMRCCCCTLIFAVILIVGIVAAFLLWVRPECPHCLLAHMLTACICPRYIYVYNTYIDLVHVSTLAHPHTVITLYDIRRSGRQTSNSRA